MSRAKKLYLLLGVLAVICAATFAVSRIEQRKEDIKNSDEIIMELDSDTVVSLSWECASGDYAFHKDGVWQYDGDAEFPVSEEKIGELLGEFTAFGASFTIENVDDYGQYGLDDPVCTIKIETDEASYEIKLGDYSTMDSERYVSIGDGKVYLVSDDPLELYNVELSTLIENDETPSYDEVQEMAFDGEGSDTTYTVSYQENGDSYREDDVYFAGSLPLDTTKVNSYLSTLKYLDLTDYVTYKATDDELAEYGLDDPELTVTLKYTPSEEASNDEADGTEKDSTESDESDDSLTFVLHISRSPEERSAGTPTDSEDETVTAYARVGESKIIYNLSSSAYKTLMAYTRDDLRHSEILPAELEDISQLDVSLDGTEYTFTMDEDADTWYYGDEELTSDDLTMALDAISAESFIDEEATEKEEISFTVHLKSDSSPAVQISLYRYDGSYCLAAIDGETIALIPRSQVVDLIEAVNAIVLN